MRRRQDRNKTHRYAHVDHDIITFKCCECGVRTDIPDKQPLDTSNIPDGKKATP